MSPSLTWVPPYSGKRTVSPSFTETGITFPDLSLDPGPTATTLPELSWSAQSQPLDPDNQERKNTESQGKKGSDLKITLVEDSGRRIPALVLEGGTIFSTRTRLRVGIRRFHAMKIWDWKIRVRGRGWFSCGMRDWGRRWWFGGFKMGGQLRKRNRRSRRSGLSWKVLGLGFWGF